MPGQRRSYAPFPVCFCSLPSCRIARESANPFFKPYATPFETPPFEQIREEHYVPAFQAGIAQQSSEIQTMVNAAIKPTFENTVEALENSGELLTRVRAVFYNLSSANTNDRMQQIAREMAPVLSKHRDDILLNARLFQRIKTVYAQRKSLSLEKRRLVEEYYKDFIRSGADLDAKAKEELRRINQRLSVLSLEFGDNVLKEDNNFYLAITDKSDLAGLPDNVITAAAEAAHERHMDGQWVITLHKPSLIPFLQYSEKRALRQKMFEAYVERCNHANEFDNKQNASEIAALRVRKANLLGYKTHADFILAENMAKTPAEVYTFLDKIWQPALARARQEIVDMEAVVHREGQTFSLSPWDWWYYSEKVKKEKYDLDEEQLRPYFKLENVIQGVFTVANRLYGITLTERKDIPTYHPDVKVFEVKEADGTHIGILYTDYFPRASKRGGAWMNELRSAYWKNGKKITPVVCNVGNFSKPTADQPSLLSLDEVSTLFHEFGHALHGLLSNVPYEKLADVPQDFVELPSQIMENWAFVPEVLRLYARHYQTNEPIPQTLIDKMEKSKQFNQGFITVEYLAASYLDMDWHTLPDTLRRDAAAFETTSLQRIGLMPEIVVRYRTPYFRHIFAGGYSSGYYSYIWAEVLDTDAFAAFQETSLFDKKTAQSFRNNILAAGGVKDAMAMYKQFRGREPHIAALLKKRGL
jgi:peptidyl-dipeptidase Dcp